MKCRECGVRLRLGKNFTASRKRRRDATCTPCRREYLRLWRAKHPGWFRVYLTSSPGRYSGAKSYARQYRKIFTLTFEEYAHLISKPCHYCFGPLSPTGVGLDQICPGEGYTLDNVVPCCGVCNMVKGSFFTYDEMRTHLAPAIRDAISARTTDGIARCTPPSTEVRDRGGPSQTE